MARIDYRGGTALITGASAGLGAQFARALAARGSDLVLVARRADRLEGLAAELRTAHGVQVLVVAADLAAAGGTDEVVRAVAAADVRVTTLVNNAGFGTYGPLHEADAARILEEVDLNVRALTALTAAYLPELRTASGALVNVASTAAFQPIPGMAVYAATKAYVLSLTEAIWGEARGTALRVLGLCPGATRTEFFDVIGTDRAKVGGFQSAEQVVDLALARLDRDAGPTVVAGLGNRALTVAERLVPRAALVRMAGSSVD